MGKRSHIPDKRFRRAANRRGDIGLGHRKLRPEPGESPDKIVGDENLPAAMGPGADPDGRDMELPGDFAGQFGLDQLHDDRKSPGFQPGLFLFSWTRAMDTHQNKRRGLSRASQ